MNAQEQQCLFEQPELFFDDCPQKREERDGRPDRPTPKPQKERGVDPWPAHMRFD